MVSLILKSLSGFWFLLESIVGTRALLTHYMLIPIRYIHAT